MGPKVWIDGGTRGPGGRLRTRSGFGDVRQAAFGNLELRSEVLCLKAMRMKQGAEAEEEENKGRQGA